MIVLGVILIILGLFFTAKSLLALFLVIVGLAVLLSARR